MSSPVQERGVRYGTFTGPIDISAATAGQIVFPATQNASSDANTLDDYEEGTWTPTIAGSSTAGSQTYSAQVGRYTKIGNRCAISGRLAMTAADGATAGTLMLRTLPFTSANVANNYAALAIAEWIFNLAAGYTQVGAEVDINATQAIMVQCGDNVAAAAVTSAELLSNSTIIFGGVYQTA